MSVANPVCNRLRPSGIPLPFPLHPRRKSAAGATFLALLAFGCAPAAAQLAGTYTVNPALPASASNFASLASAVAALQSQGVRGPVFLDLYDDAGPFREDQPFTTSNVNWSLQPAPAPGVAAPAANAVLVLANFPGASAQNRIVFRAGPGEQPVLDAQNRSMGVFWNGADYVTLQGLEIRGAVYDAISIYSESQHGQVFDPVIRGCRIHDCGGAGIVLHGNVPAVQNPLIENCFFWSLQTTNAGGFSTVSRVGYISWRRQNGLRIRSNSFYANSGAGGLFCVIGGIPGSWSETPCAEFSDNVILKTARSGRPVFMYLDIGTVSGLPLVQERNCVLDLTASDYAHHGATANLVSPSLAVWRGATGRDLATLAADPLFVDPVNGDLHLQPGSPCIDACAGGCATPDDCDGQGRSGPADLGADEVSTVAPARVNVAGYGSSAGLGTRATIGTDQLPWRGNAAFSVGLAGTLPNSQAWLFGATSIAAAPLPLSPDAMCWLDIPSMLALVAAGWAPIGPVATDSLGNASFPLPIAPAISLQNAHLALQAVTLDPAGAFPFQVSNALELIIN